MPRPAFASASRDDLALELAATAARLIAENGCDYGTAKRKAVQLVLGDSGTARRRLLPENELIESELRRYLRTFGGASHGALLGGLRRQALALMEYLVQFNPHLVGAVLNGTATEHSALHLHLFTDSAKDVEIFLLNDGLRFGVCEPNEADVALETIQLRLPPQLAGGGEPTDVVLTVLPTDAVRVAARYRSNDPELTPTERSGRAGLPALRALLAAAQ
jgi:hypothetical protein